MNKGTRKLSLGRANDSKNVTSETPLGMVYDSEGVTLTEIAIPSRWVKHFEATLNDKQRNIHLNLVEAKDGHPKQSKEICISQPLDTIIDEYPLTNYVGERVWIRN